MHRHLGLISQEKEQLRNLEDLDKTLSSERVNNKTLDPFTVLAETYQKEKNMNSREVTNNSFDRSQLESLNVSRCTHWEREQASAAYHSKNSPFT